MICQDCGDPIRKEDWLTLFHFKAQCLDCNTRQNTPLIPIHYPYKHTHMTLYEVLHPHPYYDRLSLRAPYGVWLEASWFFHIDGLACALALHYDQPLYSPQALTLNVLEKIHQAEALSVYIIA